MYVQYVLTWLLNFLGFVFRPDSGPAELFESHGPTPTVPAPAVLIVNWEIVYVTAAPNGVPRKVMAINGKFPPDPVIATKSQSIVIRATNYLDKPIVFHAHGIDEVNHNYVDGVDGVTQWYCPLCVS
jgi:Multicopper oxidase